MWDDKEAVEGKKLKTPEYTLVIIGVVTTTITTTITTTTTATINTKATTATIKHIPIYYTLYRAGRALLYEKRN